jgi:hypothetical protein
MLTEDQLQYLNRVIVLGTPYSEYDLEQITAGKYDPAKELNLDKVRYEQLRQNNFTYTELASRGLRTLIAYFDKAPKFQVFLANEVGNGYQHPHWYLLHLLEEDGAIEAWWWASLADNAYASFRDAGYSSASSDSAFQEMEDELFENIPEEKFREIQKGVFEALQGASF